MSIKLKIIMVVMTIYIVFLGTAILAFVVMLNSALEVGQSKNSQQILDLSVSILRTCREDHLLPEKVLTSYEKQVLTSIADNKQRQIFKDDLLKKLIMLLLLNSIPFLIFGYFALMLTVSRMLKPINQLTKIITQYPNLKPEDLQFCPGSDKEVRLLTEQFRGMLENIIMYQKRLQVRSKIDGWMEMSRAIVHEVGNAIIPTKNAVALLKQTIPDNPHVSTAAKSITKMEEIFRHVRQFYKTQTITRSPFTITEELEFICLGYGTIYINSTGYNSLVISGSKIDCTQLFSNLIKNALEASADTRKPDIKVSLSIENDDLIIRITDNGVGIPQEALEKIFSPGYSSKSNGFGIGLALVEKIISLHDWSISVNSKSGEGTQFTIIIPKRDILERISADIR